MNKIGKKPETLGRMKVIATSIMDRNERGSFLRAVKEVTSGGNYYVDKLDNSFKQTPHDLAFKKDVESKFFVIMKDGSIYRLNETVNDNGSNSIARPVKNQLMAILKTKKATLDDVDSLIELYYYSDGKKYSRFIRLFMSTGRIKSGEYPKESKGKIKLVM